MWRVGSILIGCLTTCVLGTSMNIGTNFSVPIPPNHTGQPTGNCRLSFATTSENPVVVAITPKRTEVLQTVVVDPIAGAAWDLDCLDRVSDGIEDKAVRILAPEPITVVYFGRGGQNADAFTVFPVENDEQPREYIVQSVTNECSGAAIDAFYTMSAYYDDTAITVYDSVRDDAAIVEQFVLNRQQTFTRTFTCDQIADFAGYKISSDKPLTVVSGSLRISIDCPTDPDYGYFQSLDLGYVSTEYFAPALPLLNQGPAAQYYVKIIALEDDTIGSVFDKSNIPLVAKNLEQGEVGEYTCENGNEAHRIVCNKPCVAHAYNKHACNNADMMFMFNLPAVEQSGTIGRFRGLENFPTRISVVSNTMNVLLNDVPIGRNTSWVEMEGQGGAGNIYFATIVKDPEDGNVQKLEVGGVGSFQAYAYGVVAQRVGYGDVFALGDIPLKTE